MIALGCSSQGLTWCLQRSNFSWDIVYYWWYACWTLSYTYVRVSPVSCT